MKKGLAVTFLMCALCLLGLGSNVRYIEELVIGGGPEDADGGAQIDAQGNAIFNDLQVDGTIDFPALDTANWDTAYTDRLKWDGGTGAWFNAATGRTSLGLVINTDVQAYDADLSAIGGLLSGADKLPYFSGSHAASVTIFTAFARDLLGDATAFDARETLGLGLGVNAQTYDVDLKNIGDLTPANDDVIQRKSGAWTNRTMAQLKTDLVLGTAADKAYTGSLSATDDLPTANAVIAYIASFEGFAESDAELNAFAATTGVADRLFYFTDDDPVTGTLTTFTAAARSLLDDATVGDMRTTLELGNAATGTIGTHVEAWDAYLDDIAGLTASADDVLQFKTGHWANRTIAQLKTDLALTNVTDNAQLKIASNLSDLNNATTARTNLGLRSAAVRVAEDVMTDGSNLPDGAAIKAWVEAQGYIDAITTVNKDQIANAETLSFDWADSEVADTLTASILVGSGSTSNAVDLATAEAAGTLPATKGGSGIATATDGGILLGSGTAAFTPTARPTEAQLLIGQSAGDPALAVMSGDVTMAANGAATIAANSVALTTDTTGNYVATVAAGTGITVAEADGEGATKTVTHASTSTETSENNSGSTFIQDVLIDVFGHVTGLTSTALGSASLRAAEDTLTNGSNLPDGAAITTYVTGLGYITNDTSVTKSELANSGTLGWDWADDEVADDITAGKFAGTGSTSTAVDLATAEVSGVTPVANGGTNATTASGARTSLGLVIGTNVQAYDADLADLADGTLSKSKVEDSTTWDTAYTDRMKWDGGATGLTAATGRTSLGLVIGTNVQAYDADLDDLADGSLTPSKIGNGLTDAQVDDTITVGSGGSVDNAALDAELQALAGLTSATDKMPYFTGSGTASTATFTGFARTLVDDANAATARSTLGLAVGTTTGTVAAGDDSRFHAPVTIGTANGLSLSTQALSLASATTSTSGAMSAADKEKLDGISPGGSDYIHPNHSGEVTSVGDGAQTIAAGVVTNAKLANMNTSKIKGRATAGDGAPEDLTATQVRTLLNVANGANAYVHPNHSGDVTSVADGATTIASSAVTNAKMANMVQSTFKGRKTASTGAPEDMSVADVKTLLAYTYTDVGAQPANANLNDLADGSLTPSLVGDGLTDAQVDDTITVGSGGSVDNAALDATLAALAGGGVSGKIPYWSNTNTLTEKTLSGFGINLIAETTASAARTRLGVAIGTDVQAYDATLAALAGGGVAGKIPYWSATDTLAEKALSDYGITLIDDADAATARTTLELVIGTNVQAYDADLADLADGTLSKSKVQDSTNWDTAYTDRMKWDGGSTDLVAATGRTSLGLVIGTNVQAYDATLAALAGGGVAGKIPYWSATDTLAEKPISAQGLVQVARAATSSGVSDYGLLAYYRMNTQTSMVDASGNGYSLTARNTAAPVVGKFGLCSVHSTPSSDSCQFYSSAAMANTMFGAEASTTISCWIKKAATTSGRRPFGTYYNNTHYCYLQSGSVLALVLKDGTTASSTNGTAVVHDGNWHHIAMVIDRVGDTVKVYADGVLDISVDIAAYGAFTDGSHNLFVIGNILDSASSVRWEGSLDEAIVWSRSLTAGEVEALYLAHSEYGPRPAYVPGNQTVVGDVTVQGGDVNVGIDGAISGTRGKVLLHRGSTTAPGVLCLTPGDGATPSSLFVGNDDSLYFMSNAVDPVPGNGNAVVLTNDARFHDAVTIGTANGLSLSTQAISLATATTEAAGAMSATDKTRLNGVAAGAEVNQNAFANIVTGIVTVAADDESDAVEFVAGSGISITGNAGADTVTIAATGSAGGGVKHIPIPIEDLIQDEACSGLPHVQVVGIGSGGYSERLIFLMPSDYAGEDLRLSVSFQLSAQPSDAQTLNYRVAGRADTEDIGTLFSESTPYGYATQCSVTTAMVSGKIYKKVVTIASSGLTAGDLCVLDLNLSGSLGLVQRFDLHSVSMEYTKS